MVPSDWEQLDLSGQLG